MSQVAFLLGYGVRGCRSAARTEALAEPSPTVIAIDTPLEVEAALSGMAAAVPGQSVIRFIHMIEAEDDAALSALTAGVEAVEVAMRGFPAVHARQYVVALVGRDWDSDERSVLLGLGAGVTAQFIIARSNEAAAELRPEEEEAMASDLAYALIVSSLPESSCDEGLWLAGTSAVYYRRRTLVAAVMAYHLSTFLTEELLSALPAQHTQCDEARAFVEQRLLAFGEHLQRLNRSPIGGSLHAEIRLDQSHFSRIPPELLVDSLRSFVQQATDQQLGQAVEQVRRNRAEHLAEELKAFVAATRETLERTRRVASARRFAECAADALDTPQQSLHIALSASDEDDLADAAEQDAVERELAKAIHALPYPWAVSARMAGLGALGIALYHLLAIVTSLDPNFAVLGLLGGFLLASPLALRHRDVRRRIDLLRRRYLALAERRARSRAKRAILEAALGEVRELQQGLRGAPDSLAARLDGLTTVLAEMASSQSALVQDRDTPALFSTRLSLLVPTPDTISTRALIEQRSLPADLRFKEFAMGAIADRWEAGDPDKDAIVAAILEPFEPALDARLWRDLSVLVKDSDATRATLHRILTEQTAPIVRRDELTTDQGSVRRMLATPNDSIAAAVRDEVSNAGTLDLHDPDASIQVALRAVPAAMLGPGSRR